MTQATRLPGLEMLRLVAASCVLFLHALANYGGAQWMGRGYLGVDFFLMLSGFLMARTQEARFAQGQSPWRFMLRRYARLWPMMALGGVIGLPRLYLKAASLGAFLSAALPNLLLIPVPWFVFVTPLNVPAWTIACELLCNSLHATLLWRLRKKWIALVLVALLPVELWIGVHYGDYNVGAKVENFLPGAARCLFAYALGIALARWWRYGLPPAPPWWIAVPMMPVLLAGSIALRQWGPGYELIFILLICPMMIAGALRLESLHGLAAWMGRIAFPLFALQMPILEGLRLLHGTYWQAVALAYAASVVAAVTSFSMAQRRKIHTPM